MWDFTMENSTKQQLLRNDFFLRSIYSKYLIASVLAMLATSVAGMIDTVIVGRFLGETGLAAMSLVSPVYLIYYTIGAVIGMGGSIAANLAIGRNDYAAYRRIFTLAFWTTAVLCVVTTAGGLLFLDPLVRLLGGEGVVGSYLTDYLRWYILGGQFYPVHLYPAPFFENGGKTADFILFIPAVQRPEHSFYLSVYVAGVQYGHQRGQYCHRSVYGDYGAFRTVYPVPKNTEHPAC